ncbi:MAG TPA: hypothetical protein VJB57_07785 [Dehalococcoidia bacterium]|nr:hypothetical protein [Dehalococcoidia bacterium]
MEPLVPLVVAGTLILVFLFLVLAGNMIVMVGGQEVGVMERRYFGRAVAAAMRATASTRRSSPSCCQSATATTTPAPTARTQTGRRAGRSTSPPRSPSPPVQAEERGRCEIRFFPG